MNRVTSAALGVAFSVAIVAGAQAETLATPVDLPMGSVIDLVVEKTREQSGSGAKPKSTATFRYRQSIAPTDEGYVVTQTLAGFDVPPEARDAMAQASGAMKKVTYETDVSLAPTKIRDRSVFVDELFASLRSLMAAEGDGKDGRDLAERVLPTTRAMFDQMSDEVFARTMLKEQATVSQLQSIEIDLTKPVVETAESPNPFGGQAPIKHTLTVKLESLDRKAGRATVSMATTFDPESLKASAMALLERVVPEQREKARAEFASMTMNMGNACRYDIDLKTGLTAKMDCTTTVTTPSEEGGLERLVERVAVTQTLKLP